MKPAQLTLWDDTRQDGIISAPVTHEIDAAIWQRCQKSPLNLKEYDTDALRAWLLTWGKRHGYPGFSFPFSRYDQTDRRYGLVYAGEARWKSDLQPPHTQREWYAGEWLVKCIEQVRRYDSGIEKMAWIEFGLGHPNTLTRSEEE